MEVFAFSLPMKSPLSPTRQLSAQRLPSVSSAPAWFSWVVFPARRSWVGWIFPGHAAVPPLRWWLPLQQFWSLFLPCFGKLCCGSKMPWEIVRIGDTESRVGFFCCFVERCQRVESDMWWSICELPLKACPEWPIKGEADYVVPYASERSRSAIYLPPRIKFGPPLSSSVFCFFDMWWHGLSVYEIFMTSFLLGL